MIFCVSGESGILKLYDLKSYDKGPFDTFVVSFYIKHYPDTNPSCSWLAACYLAALLLRAFLFGRDV